MSDAESIALISAGVLVLLGLATIGWLMRSRIRR